MRIKMPAVRIAQADVEMQQQHSDVLTCGACQKAFALGDIVKFIQHKVLSCNKENYSCNPTSRGASVESGDSDDGGVGVVSSRRPSISAPIKKVSSSASSGGGGGGGGVVGARVLCSPPDGVAGVVVLDDPRCSTPKRRPPSTPGHLATTDEEDASGVVKSSSKVMNDAMVCDSTPPHSSPEEGPCKKLRTDVADAQSNTTNSEPSNYVCSTCKARLHSAWRLIQHVQNSHGMKIYVDSTSSSGGNSVSSVGSSPGTSSNPGKNQSNSSTCSSSSSGCSSSGGNPTGGRRTPVSLGVPPRLGIPTSSPLVEPHIPLHNPFTMGGILRMPLEPPRHHQFPPSSLAPNTGSLFARPSSHNEHHFRMDQLVSEQFRLSQHHSLGLAAAVAAAATGVPPHHPTFCPPPPSERPSPIMPTTSVARTSVPPPPPPPSLPLSLEPQLDFYSQRLRQLAGTTSPGASSDNPSPHRKLTPPFTSPNATPQQPTNLTSSSNSNNNNNSTTTNNNNVDIRISSPPTTETSSTHDEAKTQPTSTPISERPESTIARIAPSPPSKPTDFSMNAISDNVDSSDGRIHACDYCGKKFRFQSNLIVHRRSHTGEKPFKCSVCNHACSQSSKLKRHMKVHKRSRNKPSSSDDGGNPNGHTSLSSSHDQASNEGSLGTMDDDEDDDDEMEDDEDDEEEEDEDEDEEMEVEEEEGDEDDDVGGDAPEDLTTKSTSSTPPTMGEGGKGGGSSHTSEKVSSGSLVGELMDKYGLSNIQQYSEAYKQALQESVGAAHHIIKKEEILQRSHFINDNNNIGSKPPPRLENGFLDKTAAMRFREEFAKNMMAGQPPLDLVGGPHGFFGSPFENPFDASKRLKLEPPDGSLMRPNDRDSLYPSMWLPAMAAHHREQMFGSNGGESEILKGKSKHSSGSSSASLAAAAAAAAALNLGIPPQSLKKESRRNDTCEFCGKVFKNCSNLTVHRRSHTGEKPYKCELCSYACAQSSKLTRHMKTHGRMGKDVYRCRFCEMPFSVPSTLEKHMRKCVVNQNIKVEHILPSMLSGDEDSISQPKDVATT